jgi:hypothetical protein
MGFSVSQFADDVDPIEAKEIAPIGFEILYDGSLFSYDKGAAIEVKIGVIAGSDDDINLKTLLQVKKGTVSILPISDVTTMVVTYPDGGRVILSNGTIFAGPFLDSIQASGRKKGNVYSFAFGSFLGAQSATELVAGLASSALSLL